MGDNFVESLLVCIDVTFIFDDTHKLVIELLACLCIEPELMTVTAFSVLNTQRQGTC